jgi:hypothetical protein
MGFGREGAICEKHDIMQIPPRFEQRSAAYKCITGVWQYASADVFEGTAGTGFIAAAVPAVS